MENCWANIWRMNKKEKAKEKPQKLVVLKRPTEEGIGSRYELGRLERAEFGSGTYLCIDRNTGEELACKSIPKIKLTTAIHIEEVRREVEIMRHLPKHPNIVSLKDIYEDDDDVHLVMERCEGADLFDSIARRSYTEGEAASVIKTILQVVQICHEHGVMHRNLKLINILYANNKETSPLKVTDFSLSIFFKPGERFNEIVGSTYYMAPEILERNYGPEIDIWSAGVILYMLLSGDPVIFGEYEHGDTLTFIRWVLDFKRETWSKVSDNAKDLVKKMIDPDPKCRITANEVLDHPWFQNDKSTSDVSLGETVSSCNFLQ